MKSYFLAPIESRSSAFAALTAALPGQTEPWLLRGGDGDVIAYFSIAEADDATGSRTIQADISGRHFNRDAEVIVVLETLRETIGGKITSDA
jgi:hypothetical protein